VQPHQETFESILLNVYVSVAVLFAIRCPSLW